MSATPGHDPAAVAARTCAIVLAAGSSRRLGGGDKILASLAGRPVIWHSLTALAVVGVGRIVLVASSANLSQLSEQVGTPGWPPVEAIVTGGERRQDSVRNGLAVAGDAAWILVHDGARPLVSRDLMERGLQSVAEHGAAVAAVPVKDTIKRADQSGRVVDTPPRDGLWAVQTPQLFRADLLRVAHDVVTGDVTDDASQVEALGHPVFLFPGSYENIKITTPEDFAVAEAFLRQRAACG